MKRLFTFALILSCLLPCAAADKAIHQLNAGVTAANGDRFPIDRFNGASWANFYLTVADLKSLFNITTTTTYVTNNYVWSTNYVDQSTYVSNYFFTNVYQDTYMSNFYQTNWYTTNNTWNYEISTNTYWTYTTNLINNYSYPSNFFQTNIFVTDASVSNYFLTNITYWTTNFLTQITTNVFTGQTNAFILDKVNVATGASNTFNGDVYINGQLYVNSTSTNTAFGGNVSATGVFSGDGSGLTNLLVQTTNVYNTNITITAKTFISQNFYSTSNYLDKLTITNQTYYVTNSWDGPTNVVNIGGPYDQNFAATSDCQITGITNKTSYTTAEVLLSIYNTAATNITVRQPDGFKDGDYVSSHTITNGTTGYFWLRYTPVGPRTNVVFRQM